MKKLTVFALLASATIAHAGSLSGYLEGRKPFGMAQGGKPKLSLSGMDLQSEWS